MDQWPYLEGDIEAFKKWLDSPMYICPITTTRRKYMEKVGQSIDDLFSGFLAGRISERKEQAKEVK